MRRDRGDGKEAERRGGREKDKYGKYWLTQEEGHEGEPTFWKTFK